MAGSYTAPGVNVKKVAGQLARFQGHFTLLAEDKVGAAGADRVSGTVVLVTAAHQWDES
jgi:hypothetical protein